MINNPISYRRKIELLAPANSLLGLKSVILAGADAVYIGGKYFGARAYADNPEEEELIHGIEFAHQKGRKVYLTVNTLLKDQELDRLYDYVLPYYQHGIDAVLVQDLGVLSYLHDCFKDLPLHASTQMTVTGPGFANYLSRYGVSRVVPARELSLEELRDIKEQTGMEVEVFIHGALCACYSGQCLYSSFKCGGEDTVKMAENGEKEAVGRRSGNRGRCAQPCRFLSLLDDHSSYQGGPDIVKRQDARHFLSPKDLNGLAAIPELLDAGIDSLKIEGRMKKPEYAAGVVSIYRKYIDLAISGKPYTIDPADSKALYDLYNRSGFTDGYFHQYHWKEMMAMVKHNLTKEETRDRHAILASMHDQFVSPAEEIDTASVKSERTRDSQQYRLPLHILKCNIAADGQTIEPDDLQPKFNALVSSQDQFQQVLEAREITEVFVESVILKDIDDACLYLYNAKRKGKRLWIALPYLERKYHQEDTLTKNAFLLLNKGLSGFLIRCPETYAYAIEHGYADHCIADAGLYSWNGETRAHYKREGIPRDTAPLELSLEELLERDNRGSDLIVYGRTPLMVTVQCLENNTAGCSEKNAVHTLKDRYGNCLLVKSICPYCYNILYDDQKRNYLDKIERIAGLGFQNLRLNFVDESPEEVKSVLKKIKPRQL